MSEALARGFPPTRHSALELARSPDATDESSAIEAIGLRPKLVTGSAENIKITHAGDFAINVKMRGRLTAYHYRHHPFDLIGWDGYLWPFRFNIANFQPITGRVHQPRRVARTSLCRPNQGQRCSP